MRASMHHVTFSLCLLAPGHLAMSKIVTELCLPYQNFIDALAINLFLRCRLGAIGQQVNEGFDVPPCYRPMSVRSGLWINQ